MQNFSATMLFHYCKVVQRNELNHDDHNYKRRKGMQYSTSEARIKDDKSNTLHEKSGHRNCPFLAVVQRTAVTIPK